MAGTRKDLAPGQRFRPWHVSLFAHTRRKAFAARLGLDPALLDGVQLEAKELQPIANAVRNRPGCRFLVFGCGNDSLFWETVNAGGETAFIEDSAEWADATRTKLHGSRVHVVAYETEASQWRDLLDAPERLRMALPAEVEQHQWDVVLVDGPAGYAPKTPGRMQSIFAAARLVALGGVVFVHDCERPIEATYAAKYLGRGRSFVKVRGHALLRGYAF